MIEPDTRVRVVMGPHRYCTGMVRSLVPPGHHTAASVLLELDTSGRVVTVPVEHVRVERASDVENMDT